MSVLVLSALKETFVHLLQNPQKVIIVKLCQKLYVHGKTL